MFRSLVDKNEQPSSSEDEDEGPDQSDELAMKNASVNEGSPNDQRENSSGADQHDQELSESDSPDKDTSIHDQETSLHDKAGSSHDQASSSYNQAESSHDHSHDQGNSSNVQEDITGLQIAWEVLELSRVILSK